MTRTKLSLVAFLLVTLLGACGGRSTLKITVDGGNAAADGGAGLDSKRDGTVTTDAASSNDTSVSDALSAADVSIGDAARAEAASDSARTDLLSDLLSDGRPVPDGGDAGGVDAARNDTRNGDSGDAAGDGNAQPRSVGIHIGGEPAALAVDAMPDPEGDGILQQPIAINPQQCGDSFWCHRDLADFDARVNLGHLDPIVKPRMRSQIYG